MFPIINVFKCDGCGVCVTRCPAQIMGLINDKAAYLQMLCEECGICHEVCPIHAVHFRLENFSVHKAHEAYDSPRRTVPTWGNWKIGVPLGVDGEGHPK